MQATKQGVSDRSRTDYAKLGFGGFLMGICEIIPGVSGGTMAFILGFYEEFISSLKVLGDRDFIRATFRLRIKEMFSILNWKFLLVLGVGMLIAIFTLAGVLGYLLDNYATYVWSFFFGLVLASVFIVSRRIEKWRPALIVAFIIAAIVSFLLVGLVPAQTPDTWWFYILAGAIAICAMILPGVSGSFLLVILGKYESVLNAVRTLDFGIVYGFPSLRLDFGIGDGNVFVGSFQMRLHQAVQIIHKISKFLLTQVFWLAFHINMRHGVFLFGLRLMDKAIGLIPQRFQAV